MADKDKREQTDLKTKMGRLGRKLKEKFAGKESDLESNHVKTEFKVKTKSAL